MLPNLSELERKAKELGLTITIHGKKPAKEDYVVALRAHYLAGQVLPYQAIEPMLAFAEWNLTESEQKKIWASPSWIAEEKFNGCRAIVHLVKGVGVFIHSRTISLKTYREQEMTANFLFHKWVPDFSAVLDCEVMVDKSIDTRGYTAKGEKTETTLHSTTAILHLAPESARKIQVDQDAPLMLTAFDITNLHGVDLESRPLSTRLEHLHEALALLDSEGVWPSKYFRQSRVVRGSEAEKREFYRSIVARGGEGIMLKSLNAPYVASSSRRRDGWVKVKKRMEFDAFVTGSIPGEAGSGWENYIGALEFSVATEKGPHPIAMCSNFTLEQRKEWTRIVEGVPTVKSEMIMKVAQVSGQDIAPRSLRLTHATIDRWREGADEKSAADCTANMADLKKASEWSTS